MAQTAELTTDNPRIEEQELLDGRSPVFVPRTDIYETENEITLLADMPGVDEKTLEITINRNVLTISANVAPAEPAGYALTYSEYRVGAFRRSFTLADVVAQEAISAVIANGILTLTLPKTNRCKTTRIPVRGG